ncbi:MAG: hypothetical protein WDK95_05555 [Syntrophorhabdaceae bacterium]
MDKLFIKNKLLDFCNEFKQNAGTFYSYQIVHSYISFISSDKEISIYLLPILDGLEKEAQSWENNAIDLETIKIGNDILEDLSSIPFFKDVFSSWKNDLTEKGIFKPIKALPIYFSFLSVMAYKIEEINECQNNNQIEKAKKLIEEVKEESFSFIQNPADKSKTINYSQFATVCMEMVNKFIIDEIDSQMFLGNERPKERISFDDEKSILNIDNYQIKITLKNDKPIDHYILEAIFSKEDLSEQTDFVEISEDIMKDEYNGKWERFRHACDKLNQKIFKGTNNKISDFIDYKTGKSGYCQINNKYL